MSKYDIREKHDNALFGYVFSYIEELFNNTNFIHKTRSDILQGQALIIRGVKKLLTRGVC